MSPLIFLIFLVLNHIEEYHVMCGHFRDAVRRAEGSEVVLSVTGPGGMKPEGLDLKHFPLFPV